MLKIIQLICSPLNPYGITFGMKNSINQLLICAPLCNITSNIPKFLKNTNYTSLQEVFYFFNPVNKIQNASEMNQKYQKRLPTLKISEKSEMHQKFIRNTSRCLFQDNMSRNISNHCILLRQLVPRHIHISSYITYIYPKFIPNSTFSPYISLTQIL